jgi:hypothetical protein
MRIGEVGELEMISPFQGGGLDKRMAEVPVLAANLASKMELTSMDLEVYFPFSG